MVVAASIDEAAESGAAVDAGAVDDATEEVGVTCVDEAVPSIDAGVVVHDVAEIAIDAGSKALKGDGDDDVDEVPAAAAAN